MEGRRRITLYDQMTAGDTSRRDSLAALILNDVVLATSQESETTTARSRTLLDIIKEDESNNNNRRSWKAFKDKLRLNRTGAGSVWTSTSTTTQNNNNNNTTSLSQFSQQGNDVVDEDPDNAAPITREPPLRGGENDSAEAAGRVSMLLMDLLEETTDHETELQVSSYKMISDDDEKEEKCGDQEEWGVVGDNCCVCMVRHKGAAFIPCGHTFCRMCCREIWVSRGNCPLCNNFILEILDIF